MSVKPIGVVLAVNLALAAALALLWQEPARYRWVEPEPVRPVLDEAMAAAAPEAVDVSRYRETIERPLFAPSRRPASRETTAEAAGPALDLARDVQLLGLYGAGGKGGAIVRHKGKLERVPYGGRIGEWTIEGEEGRGASLVRSDGQRQQLQMALNAAPPAAASAQEKGSGPAPAAAAGGSVETQPPRRAAVPRVQEDEVQRQQRIEELRARRNALRAERAGRRQTQER